MSDLLFENHGWDEVQEAIESVRASDLPPVLQPPSRVPTQPDIHVEPETLPQIQIKRSAASCYFCDERAHDDVNGIPMCEACQYRYRRDK